MTFEFLLVDAATLTAEDGRSNPVAALLRLLASRRAESLPSLAKTLFDGLRPAGRRRRGSGGRSRTDWHGR